MQILALMFYTYSLVKREGWEGEVNSVHDSVTTNFYEFGSVVKRSTVDREIFAVKNFSPVA